MIGDMCGMCLHFIYREEPTLDRHFPLRCFYWCKEHRKQVEQKDSICKVYEPYDIKKIHGIKEASDEL